MLIELFKNELQNHNQDLVFQTKKTFGSNLIHLDGHTVAQVSKASDGIDYLFLTPSRQLYRHIDNGHLKSLDVECYEKKGRSNKCKLAKVAVIAAEDEINARMVEAIVTSMIDVALNGSIKTKQTQSRSLHTHNYSSPQISKDSHLLLISQGFTDVSELSDYKPSEMYQLFDSYRHSKAINFEKAIFELMTVSESFKRTKEFEVRKVLFQATEVSLRTLCKGRA
ncbi:hypothetical protein [Vibrio agarivorans]|uniref:Uncharacterized protein n=1 Tax=Vibrio agarivorans TaxID=153622 RepID=A0ABT7Y7E6_9VIBR|nr:hypothetical protein [Vibrio agarivorans]MDN2483918.1 hypothetical protein [Vibrio agarivorans]